MCLARKTIYTNAHHIMYGGWQPYVMNIPCGKCTECEKTRSNEWKIRSYYEYLDTINDGGELYWDTLTYRNEDLPHLNQIEKNVPEKLDFSCFNRTDVQSFMKRLRSALEAEGYNPKEKLKYIIAAEYGQDERYTRRPHYHMALYNKTGCPPVKLSCMVEDAWKKGHTDGWRHKSYQDFWENNVIKTPKQALLVANYIAKYALKNQSYDAVATEKVEKLCRYWYELEYKADSYEANIFNTPEWRKRKNDILRKVKTFHLNSNGFGKYAIDCKGAIENMKIGMPDTKKRYWWTKLPKYYERKLYWTHEKINGKIIWKLNEAGKAWKRKNLEETIQQTTKVLEKRHNYYQSEPYRLTIMEDFWQQKGIPDDSRWYYLNDLVYAYLNGRSWKEYATYIIWYKGRIHNGTKLDPKWISRLMETTPERAEYIDWKNGFWNYCHRTDIDFFGKQIASCEDLGNNIQGYKIPTGKEKKPKLIAKEYCIDENSYKEFNDFDKLTEVLQEMDHYIDKNERSKKTTHENTKRYLQNLKLNLYG